MGVTKLWNVLKNTKQVITLNDIKGKTLAVDLAAWICELENVKQTHCYLRNFFFRVSAMIKADVVLIFILDGKPPELKWETISKRLGSDSGGGKKYSGVRSRLNAKLKECCRLFDALGVPWIKAEGEAEALCAALNKAKLVDGVVTCDGDAFLYGAQTVYKNFSIEKHGGMERYCIEEIEESLHLDQRGLIALGLLLGCDYCPKGVPGVGEAQALKLLSRWHGSDALAIFLSWREGGHSGKTKPQTKPPHCATCGHKGTKKEHIASCCQICGRNCANFKTPNKEVPCSCDWHKDEDDRKELAFEEKIKTLALKDPRFPDRSIIIEFLKSQRYIKGTKTFDLRENVDLKKTFRLKPPMLDEACIYLEQKANWTSSYTIEKVLPLLTHFLLTSSNTEATRSDIPIQLKRIIKKRLKDHVESLEVEWQLSHETDAKIAGSNELVTIESKERLTSIYPCAVQQFYEKLQNEKQEKVAKTRKEQKKNKKTKETGAISKEPQNAKMTDYFKTKKLRKVDRLQSEIPDQEETTIAEIESALSDLLISKQDSSSPEVKEISKDNKCGNIVTECHSKSGDHSNVLYPKIVFSSDSEDEATEIGNIVNKISVMNIGESPINSFKPTTANCLELQGGTNDITFSDDLNFSLGCSLLQTPVLKEKENRCPLSEQLDESVLSIPAERSYIEPKALCEVSTNTSKLRCENNVISSKKSRDYSLSPQSPVFMTLMERLKARKNS